MQNINTDTPICKSPVYQHLEVKWNFLSDMWRGREAWVNPIEGVTDHLKATNYLPKMSDEPPEEWVARVKRAYFKYRFQKAIISSSGFLAEFVLDDKVPESIRLNQDNIDGEGNSLKLFLEKADQKALRDEHCFILVDFPKMPTTADGEPAIIDAFSEAEHNRRPYLVLIDAIDVLNWEIETINGLKKITQVTIRETYTEKTGRFNSEIKTQYRVLYPGGYEVWKFSNKDTLEIVEDGVSTFSEVPLVVYSVTDDGNLFSGYPPLYPLAELDLELYQKSSQKDEALLKSNMPLYNLNELNPKPRPPGEEHQSRRVSLGPNSVLWNVQASVVEPSGSAIAETQADLDRLLLQAEQMTLAFQSGYFSPPTATEVNAASSTKRASLVTMARAKESAVAKIFKLWAAWMGESKEGGIIVDRTLIQAAIDSAQSQLLLSLRKNGDLSRVGLFKLLQLGRVFPNDFDIDEELERIKEDNNLDIEERKTKIYDTLLKHQVVDADEVARAIKENKTLSDVIDMERREHEQISVFPEGFVATQRDSGFGENLQQSSDDMDE